MFRIKCPVFQQLMKTLFLIVSPMMYERQVTDRAGAITMNSLSVKRKKLKYILYAMYATDVTFQKSNRPAENNQESKRYLSGNHKLYGYKVEVSVLPNGMALEFSLHQPGSVSDIAIFREAFDLHEDASAKWHGDIVLSDHDHLRSQFPMKWAIRTDKVHKRDKDTLRVLYPMKK